MKEGSTGKKNGKIRGRQERADCRKKDIQQNNEVEEPVEEKGPRLDPSQRPEKRAWVCFGLEKKKGCSRNREKKGKKENFNTPWTDTGWESEEYPIVQNQPDNGSDSMEGERGMWGNWGGNESKKSHLLGGAKTMQKRGGLGSLIKLQTDADDNGGKGL